MKRLVLMLCVSLLIGTLAIGCGGNGENGAVDDGEDVVIKIGHAPYDYEEPMIEVATQIAEEYGYEVEVVEGDVGFMFMSLANGDIDLWPGVWLPSIHGTYIEDYGDDFELGSEIYTDAPIGWAVPEYVDIDSIDEIQGNEEAVGGQVVGLEPGAGMMEVSENIIEGYELDLELLSGSTSSMMAEVDYATQHEEPIVFLAWRPHVMFRNYDLKMLDDPKGYWELDSHIWGIRDGFEDQAPEIYNLVNNFKMSIEDTEWFLVGYQEEGEELSELAAEWIEDNRSDIDSWLEN